MEHRATFTRMEDSTAADWQTIGGEFMQFAAQLPDRIITHLRLLENDYGGFPVDRYTHCLQTATRALKDGRDEEYVVCALLHDIGDTLGSYNHPEIGAAILRPFVAEAHHWMVLNHAVFQGYYYFHHAGLDRHARERFRVVVNVFGNAADDGIDLFLQRRLVFSAHLRDRLDLLAEGFEILADRFHQFLQYMI